MSSPEQAHGPGHGHPGGDPGHEAHGHEAHPEETHEHGPHEHGPHEHGPHEHGPHEGGTHEGGAHDHGAHDDGAHDHQHRAGLRGLVGSVLSPHSHDAAESVDAALESSADGMRCLKLSLAALAGTAAFQLLIVAVSGSVALFGDSIHNFADALTAVPLGFAFWLGRRPPTKRYTYGYGRAEDLAGVFIVAMIALSSGVAGWEAIHRLLHPHSFHHLPWVVVAGLVGFAGNELVGLYRIRVGRRIGSAALVADGLHARTDGFTSLAVVIGAAGVAAGWRAADPVVGLVITVAILAILKGAARDIYRRLMDSVDPGLVERVHQVLSEAGGVEAVDSVRIRWVGHELRAEVEVVSDSDLTLTQAHDIAEGAHHLLLHEIPRLAQAIIHTNPSSHDGRDHHATTAHHFKPARTPPTRPLG